MSTTALQLSKQYPNFKIKMVNTITTEKYKLPLYTFIVSDNQKLQYYIAIQDLIANFGDSIRMRVFDYKTNECFHVNECDYVAYNNRGYIRNSLFQSLNKTPVGWEDMDVNDVTKDIYNAIVIHETRYEEAVRDFIDYEPNQNGKIINKGELLYLFSKAYNFISNDVCEEMVNFIIDHAKVNEHVIVKTNGINPTYKEAYEYIRDIIESYEKEFGKEETLKEEVESIPSQQEKDMEAFIESVDNMNDNDFIETIEEHNMLTQNNNAINFDPSKLGLFIYKMENGIIDRIRREHKFPPGYLKKRCEQEACYLMYNLTLVDATDINYKKPKTYYLGIEILGIFFLDKIYRKDAYYDYKYKDVNGIERKEKIPFIGGYDIDGSPYNGLLEKATYDSILRENLVLMFPGLKEEQITLNHIDIALKYCNDNCHFLEESKK